MGNNNIEKLKQENLELRLMLDEAQETLRAIRSGEVDALVVTSDEGEKIFTLESAEKPYRIFLENMFESALIINSEMMITFCNSSFADLLKIPLDKIIGTSFLNYIESDFGELFIELFQKTVNKKSHGEFIIQSVNKKNIIVKMVIEAIKGNNEELYSLILFDITELKKTEQNLYKLTEMLEERVKERTAEIEKINKELLESRAASLNLMEDSLKSQKQIEGLFKELVISHERLDLAQKSAGAGIWYWDIVSGKQEWSAQLYRIFELDPAKTEANNDNWRNIIYSEDIEKVERSIETAIKYHSQLNLDYRILLPNNNFKWINLLGNAIYDTNDNALRMTGICIDITEQKGAEEKIKRQNLILESIAKLFNDTLNCKTYEEIGKVCLDVAGKVTDSNIGFISELNEKSELETVATLYPGWEDFKINFEKETGNKYQSFFNIRGIFGKVLTDGKSFYTNSPESHPDKIGVPSWHVKLNSFMGVPLKYSGNTIGIVAVGNKEGGYSNDDLEALETLTEPIFQVLYRKKAEDVLRESEEKRLIAEASREERQRFNEMLDKLPAYVALLSPDYHIPFANKYFEERFGKSNGKKCYEYLFNRDTPCENCKTYDVYKTNSPQHWEWTGPDGKIYDISDFPFTDSDGTKMIMEVGLDITERKNAETELNKTNRALRTISACNQIQIHSSTEEELLTQTCYAIIQESGYRLAWIGYAENDENKSVKPVAWAGFEDGYLETANISWADNERGAGPTGSAIRLGEVKICQNMQEDECFKPWRENAIKRGYNSSIVLPLKENNITFGALSIYATEPDAFNKEEIELLKELSEDLSYSILAIKNRLEKKKAQQLLADREKELETLFNLLPVGISVIDDKRNILKSNPAFESLYKIPEEKKSNVRSLDRKYLRSDLTIMPQWEFPSFEAFEKSEKVNEKEIGILKEDGELLWVSVSAAPLNKNSVVVVSKDITEKRNAEKKIRESEANLNLAQKLAKIGSFVYSVANKEMKWSDEMFNIFGRSKELGEPTYKGLSRYFTKESWQVHNRLIRNAIKKGEDYNGEFKYINDENNEEGWINIIGKVAIDSTGKVYEIIGTVQDITERKIVMQELDKLNSETLDLYNNAPCGYHSIDKDGMFLKMNYTELKWLGYRRDEVIEVMNISEILTTESYEIFKKNFPVFIEKGHLNDLELEFKRKDSSTFYISLNSTAVYDEEGNYKHSRSSVFDITARKIAEKKLEQSSKNWNDTFKAINDHIWLLDKNGIVIQSNKFTKESICNSCSEEIGNKCFSLMHSTESFIEDCPFKAMHISRQREVREQVRNGKTYSVTVDPIFNEDDEFIGAVHIMSDITKLKEAEKQMRDLAMHIQKVREEERTALSRTLHDNFGQYLTGLKMEVSSFEKKLKKIAPDNVSQGLQEKIESMKSILDDLVVLTGKLSMELRPNMLDVLGLIPSIEWLAKDFKEKSGIECVFENSISSPDLEPKCSTEVFRILQEALTNIIRHANATKVTIKFVSDLNGYIVSVQDNGRGIKEEEKKSPYSLGLLGMRERALVFNGEVEIIGKEQKGTKLTIKIPNNKL